MRTCKSLPLSLCTVPFWTPFSFFVCSFCPLASRTWAKYVPCLHHKVPYITYCSVSMAVENMLEKSNIYLAVIITVVMASYSVHGVVAYITIIYLACDFTCIQSCVCSLLKASYLITVFMIFFVLYCTVLTVGDTSSYHTWYCTLNNKPSDLCYHV